MATCIINEGADALSSSTSFGTLPNADDRGFFESSRFDDSARVDHRRRRLIDRSAIISRSASVLIDMLEQNAAGVDSPDALTPLFLPCHRGAVAALVRESLEMLADEASGFISDREQWGLQ